MPVVTYYVDTRYRQPELAALIHNTEHPPPSAANRPRKKPQTPKETKTRGNATAAEEETGGHVHAPVVGVPVVTHPLKYKMSFIEQ